MSVGTCDCPVIVAQYPNQVDYCSNTADVEDIGPDSDGEDYYKCTCSAGHEQYFGLEFYNEFVTPNP